jgi:hypothetical protein
VGDATLETASKEAVQYHWSEGFVRSDILLAWESPGENVIEPLFDLVSNKDLSSNHLVF